MTTEQTQQTEQDADVLLADVIELAIRSVFSLPSATNGVQCAIERTDRTEITLVVSIGGGARSVFGVSVKEHGHVE